MNHVNRFERYAVPIGGSGRSRQAMDHDAMQRVADAYTAAWNSGSPEAVAEFFTPDGGIVINRGTPWNGRSGVAEMAAGFYADVPDLALVCDGVHVAGDHVLYRWTFTGTHAASGNPMRVSGWEEWDMAPDGKVASSRGWFDADDYARQAAANP
jgi:uncharacterized protein (TIGR02246 family)